MIVKKEKVCLLCGRREPMIGFICQACKAKLQAEAREKYEKERKKAEQALKKYGEHGNKPST